MLLLAPGPVPIAPELAQLGNVEMLPYFRGSVFANMMLELTEDLKHLFQTKASPLTITASGTGLMEMAIVNLLNPGDRVVVLNGGNFGKKWINMCKAFRVQVSEYNIAPGKSPDLDVLNDLILPDVKALLLNAHETSTGYLFDLKKIGEMTTRKSILFIVDGVSSIGADEYRMDEWNIDCSMASTQKALGLMPGLGFIVFSDRARAVIPTVSQPRFYFDAMDYANNITRGMTPFTPAMNAILQAREQIKQIKNMGIQAFVDLHLNRAKAFREVIIDQRGFGMFPERPSNALSAIRLPPNVTADDLIHVLRDKYDWWLAPNPLKSEDFIRVSHMGNLSVETMTEVAKTILKEAMHIQQHRSRQQ